MTFAMIAIFPLDDIKFPPPKVAPPASTEEEDGGRVGKRSGVAKTCTLENLELQENMTKLLQLFYVPLVLPGTF